ncbi:MAG: hypothetical protein BRD55_06570 [Bacteroidetes bacterium SW_9_63_38]|nr:MAG: hypothetical protein BRD55_06570 [Bacteroidetes bacterium SW_9_63_38]
MARPLDVHADLQLTVDGEDIDIQSAGDRIMVEVPSLDAGRRVLHAVPFSQRGRARTARQAQEILTEVGLTLELQLDGTPLAVIGADARPGRLGRFLPTGGVELHPSQTLRRAARERPFLAVAVVGGFFALIGWCVARLVRS